MKRYGVLMLLIGLLLLLVCSANAVDPRPIDPRPSVASLVYYYPHIKIIHEIDTDTGFAFAYFPNKRVCLIDSQYKVVDIRTSNMRGYITNVRNVGSPIIGATGENLTIGSRAGGYGELRKIDGVFRIDLSHPMQVPMEPITDVTGSMTTGISQPGESKKIKSIFKDM